MEADLALDVLQVVDSIDCSGTAVRSHTDPGLVPDPVRYLHVSDHGGGLADVLQRDIPPLLRHLHNGPGIHEPVPELVIVHSAPAILDPALLIEKRTWGGGHDDQVLHVSPGQAGVGLQGQGGLHRWAERGAGRGRVRADS